MRADATPARAPGAVGRRRLALGAGLLLLLAVVVLGAWWRLRTSAPAWAALDASATAASPAAVAAVPPATLDVALVLHRFAGAPGPALVSAGIPLPPGAVRPEQLPWVRVLVGDSQPAQRVLPLHSRHPDGSLRAVLVQFRADVPAGLGAAARLAVGERRTAGDLGGAAPVEGLPAVVALPREPAYLVGTGLVGPTRTSAETRRLGLTYARYEEDFRTFSERLWAFEGARWEGNYYDRALIYYAWWARTGDPMYWRRATEIAVNYRRGFLEANAADPYKSSPHWAQLGGLATHYLLTGDEASRVAVVRTADVLNVFNPSYMTRAVGESRIAARLVQSALLAWQLTPAGAPWPAGAERADWGGRLERHLAAVYAWQQPDGSYPANGQVCGGQLNYMVGLLNDALIQVHDDYRADPRLVDAVRRAADYMWRTQWRPEAQSFKYASVLCAKNGEGFGVGGPEPAPDLNGLLVTTYAWLASQARDPAERETYRQRASAVFAGGVARAYLGGSKQFNEHYGGSFRALGYL